MAVYFGGSRSLSWSAAPQVRSVVAAILQSGQAVHVGCQRGADAQVISSWLSVRGSSLVVFAVAGALSFSPTWVQSAQSCGAQVVLGAGGQSAPIHARYLLRSIAAFRGCSQAVFFQPGPGSLAVARECVAQGLQVFAFQQSAPAPVPQQAGQWVPSSFHGFPCWSWSPAQLSLF